MVQIPRKCNIVESRVSIYNRVIENSFYLITIIYPLEMLSLILPSKHGGYPGFRSGKLTQENDGMFVVSWSPPDPLSDMFYRLQLRRCRQAHPFYSKVSRTAIHCCEYLTDRSLVLEDSWFMITVRLCYYAPLLSPQFGKQGFRGYRVQRIPDRHVFVFPFRCLSYPGPFFLESSIFRVLRIFDF